VLVPDSVRLPTAEARLILPSQVPFVDAVFNASHAAAATIALTSQPRLLHDVLRDRLHQEARLRLAPDVKVLFDELWAAGVPVCVSGAGPSLLAFELERAIPEPGAGWRTLRPGIASTGVRVEEA
jgi:homoserine kinase